MPECLRKCSVQKIRRIPVQFPSQVSDRAKESRGFSAAPRDMQSAPLEVAVTALDDGLRLLCAACACLEGGQVRTPECGTSPRAHGRSGGEADGLVLSQKTFSVTCR